MPPQVKSKFQVESIPVHYDCLVCALDTDPEGTACRRNYSSVPACCVPQIGTYKNTFLRTKQLCVQNSHLLCVQSLKHLTALSNGGRELTSAHDELFHSTAAPGHHCWCRSVPASLLVRAPACMYSFLNSTGWKDQVIIKQFEIHPEKEQEQEMVLF